MASGQGRAGPSFSVWLELESRCNLSCQFCYNAWRPGHAPKPAGLSGEEFAWITRRLLDRLPVKWVALSGGEPLLFSGLESVLTTVVELGVKAVLTTNGVLLTRDRLRGLVDLGLSGVQVPLLAANPAVHDRLSRKQCWRQAIQALALSREAGVDVSAVMVISQHNSAEVTGVVRICELLDVRSLVLNRVHIVGQAATFRDQLELTDADFGTAVESADRRPPSRLSIVHGSGSPGGGCSGRRSERDGPDRIHRITVSPSGDLKFCNESTRGLVNLTTVSEVELDRIAALLLEEDHDELLASIDVCACRGRLAS